MNGVASAKHLCPCHFLWKTLVVLTVEKKLMLSSRTAEVSQQFYKNLGLCGVVPSDKNNHRNDEVSLPEQVASYPLHRQSYSSPVQFFAGEEEDHHVMRRSTSTPANLRQSSFGGSTKSAFRKTAAFSSCSWIFGSGALVSSHHGCLSTP